MIRSFLRHVVTNSAALYILTVIIPGFVITGGFKTVVIGGMVLTCIYFFIRPVLHVLTFPLHFLTLGLFSVFTNAILLYFLTVIVPNITVKAFTYKPADIAGFLTPQIQLNTLFAFFFASAVLSFLTTAITWVMDA